MPASASAPTVEPDPAAMAATGRNDADLSIEVSLEARAPLPAELQTRQIRARSGPAAGPTKEVHNSITCVLVDAERSRIFAGMELGELLFWETRLERSDAAQRLSTHRPLGSHDGMVTAMAGLPAVAGQCGGPSLLVTGSTDQTIRIWHPRRGSAAPSEPAVLVQTLWRHACTVTTISSCAGDLISGGADGTIHLWAPAGHRDEPHARYPVFEQVRIVTKLPGWVRALTDGRRALEHDADSAVLAVDEHANVKRLEISLVASGADGSRKRSGSPRPGAKHLRVVVVGEERLPARQDRSPIAAVYDTDRGVYASASYDCVLRMHDFRSPNAGGVQATNELAVPFLSLAYDRETHQVVAGDQCGILSVYAVDGGELLATKTVSAAPILALQRVGATDCYAVATARDVAFWRLKRNLCYRVVHGGHTQAVFQLLACAGEEVRGELDYRIFSAGRDNVVCLWDPRSFECVRVYAYDVASRDRGRRAASPACGPAPSDVAGDQKSVAAPMAVDGASESSVNDGRLGELSCMTFYAAWSVLITGHAHGELALWEPASAKRFCVLRFHSDAVTCMTMAQSAGGSADTAYLATASFDGYLALWDVRRIAGSPGVQPHLVARWQHDAAPPSPSVPPPPGNGPGPTDARRSIERPAPCERVDVCSMLWHNAAPALCTGGSDHRVKVWYRGGSRYYASLRGNRDAVALCLAQDGFFLFAGTDAGRIACWNLHGVAESAVAAGPCEREPLLELDGHPAPVTGLVISRGWLVSCGADGACVWWDYVSERAVRRIQHPHPLHSLAVRADVAELLLGTAQGHILRTADDAAPPPDRDGIVAFC